LTGVYTVGDTVDGRLTVIDVETEEEIATAAVTLTLLGPAGSRAVVLWGYARYDEAQGMYLFEFDTDGLAPGTYELIFQTDTGDSEMVSIELQDASLEGT
jgi:hypothetical protein